MTTVKLNKAIGIQIKATDRPKFVAQRKTVAVRVERRDLWAWLESHTPVVLILYDAGAERAHWVLVEDYLADRPELLVGSATARVTVHLPVENVFNAEAVKRLVQYKRRIVPRLRRQAERARSHD